MTETKPRDYVIGILIFVLVIAGGMTLIDIGQSQNPDFIEPTIYSDFNESFNQRQQALNATQNLEDRVLDLNLPKPLAFLSVLFVKGYGVLTSLFSSLEFMEVIFTNIGRLYNIYLPSWVDELVIAIVSTFLIFSIVSAILQRDI